MARLNKRVPVTVTYKGLSYEIVQQKQAAPTTVTFKGAKYELISAERMEIPPEATEYMPTPVEQDIFVRMSTPDYRLLRSLPQAMEGPLRGMLDRAAQKKLNTGRAEVAASEAEVRAAISALEDFIQTEENTAAVTHAQDLMSTWKRNYLLPDKPLSKPLPSFQKELPRSTNIRMFHYKGAKYVLVQADEAPDYMKGRPSPTYEDVLETEVFSDLVTNIHPSIKDNIPISQLKRSVDAVQQAEMSLRRASDDLNNDRSPGVRWLTDAFFKGNRDKLERLLADPDLVRESINKYINDIQEALVAAQTAVTVITDISNMITERGWASKWTMKKERSALRKDILEKIYGMNEAEIKNFFSKAYEIKQERAKEPPSKEPTGKERA